MSYYIYEVKKLRVVTVEADSPEEAEKLVIEQDDDGEINWHKAEPELTLLDQED